MELVREGRADAFEVIYDRYGRQILAFCRHMVGSREEAEDAVQQCFTSAYCDLVASDRPIQLRPWLYTIARNQCLSVLRARRSTASIDDVEPAVEGLAAEVQRRQDLQDMLRDLADLPDEQRAALVLSELGALSHDEVAEVIVCSREKVKALVFQARSSLAASRTARDTPCEEIREQLATLTGGSLRRTQLRRHVKHCPGCQDFQAEVKRQRQAIAALLPVAPTLGLKQGILASVGAAGAAGTAAGGGAVAGGTGLAAILANAGAAKFVVGAAIVAGGVGGGAVALNAVEGDPSTPPKAAPAARPGPEAGGKSRSGWSTSPITPTRARGEQAPAIAPDGATGGGQPKSEHGRVTAPGQTRTGPIAPGTTPGKAGTSPGRTGTSPGQAGSTPGQQRQSTTTGGGAGSGRGAPATGEARGRSGAHRADGTTAEPAVTGALHRAAAQKLTG